MPQEESGFLVCDLYHHLYPRSLVQRRTFNHPPTQRMPSYVISSTICPFIHPTFTYQSPPTNHTLSTPHLWSDCSSQRWGWSGAWAPYKPLLTKKARSLSLFFLLERRRHVVEMQVGRGGLSVSFQLLSLTSVPLPHSTAMPEGPKVPEISYRDWHLPDIQGAQQGRHNQKVDWE